MGSTTFTIAPQLRIHGASKSDHSKSYTLTYESGDVSCTCPGFEYRGMCSHSKALKAALAADKPAPAGYEAVSD